MAKFARKLRRNLIKQKKKKLDEQIRNVEDSLQNMPKECSSCGAEFNQEESDTWTIRVTMDGASLTCPACKEVQNESKD